MKFEPNSLFYYMVKTYHENKKENNHIIFGNEGSMRSSKTMDAFHFIYLFCNQNPNAGLKIACFRNTLKDARETLYKKDFKDFICKHVQDFKPECALRENSSPEYTCYGNLIEFKGLDENVEHPAYDIAFFNEILETDSESSVIGIIARLKKCAIFDWNPKYTQHWMFEWEDRTNVFFTHTTYKNNKHLNKATIAFIESRSPWHLDDLHLPKDERRPHEDNIKNKTVDEWWFEVYGMGMRANRNGLVFPNVNWVSKLPTDVDKYFYGLDFGNTTGTFALSKGCFYNNELYFDVYIYGSFATSSEIKIDSDSGIKNFWNLFKTTIKKDDEIFVICDSAKPQFICDLNKYAENESYTVKFAPCKKFPGCIEWRLDTIKKHRINLVERAHTKKEQENYSYLVIAGVQTNQPEHKHNHGFDAIGYSIQYEDYLRL